MTYPKATQDRILAALDVPKARRTQKESILVMLADGNWHTLAEIEQRCVATSADRRLRDLRSEGIGIEWKLNPNHKANTRGTVYRLRADGGAS